MVLIDKIDQIALSKKDDKLTNFDLVSSVFEEVINDQTSIRGLYESGRLSQELPYLENREYLKAMYEASLRAYKRIN